MASEKATVTLDRGKVMAARALVRAKSISQTIDIALDRLIRSEQLRRDIAAYGRSPPTEDEVVLAELPVAFDLDDREVDYDGMYGRANRSARVRRR